MPTKYPPEVIEIKKSKIDVNEKIKNLVDMGYGKLAICKILNLPPLPPGSKIPYIKFTMTELKKLYPPEVIKIIEDEETSLNSKIRELVNIEDGGRYGFTEISRMLNVSYQRVKCTFNVKRK